MEHFHHLIISRAPSFPLHISTASTQILRVNYKCKKCSIYAVYAKLQIMAHICKKCIEGLLLGCYVIGLQEDRVHSLTRALPLR